MAEGTAAEALGGILDAATAIRHALDTGHPGGSIGIRQQCDRLVELVRIGLADLEERPQGYIELAPAVMVPDRAGEVIRLIDRVLDLGDSALDWRRMRDRG